MRICKMCLSQIIHYQHVSIAVTIIIGVTYKIIGNENRLSKCMSDHPILRSMSQTFYKVIKCHLIYY